MPLPFKYGASIYGFLLGGVLCAGHSASHAAERDVADLSIEELSKLVVTSVSRRPEALGIAASSIQVITAEDIRRSGATRIPEALRLASNLQVAQITGDSWAISARGFNSSLANKLLVMIDGRTIYSPLFAGTFWEAQGVPIYDVERIEVVSGPGGTLWGANAVNGVINIVTRPASETHGLLVRAGAGSELQRLGALRYGSAIGARTHYRFYGQYAERDAIQFPGGADAGNDSDRGQGGFRFDWSAGAADALMLSGDAGRSRTQQRGLDDAISRSQNVVLRWTRTLGERSGLQLQTYYDRAYRLSPGAFRDQLDTFDVDFLHYSSPLPAHSVVWGLTYRLSRDDFDAASIVLTPGDVSLRRFGGYVNDQIALRADELYLTVGTKIEDNEYTGLEWQPSVNLAWRYRPGKLLWGSVARAIRAPSRLERHLDNPATPPFTVGSDDFESEELLAWEIGLRTQPEGDLSFAVELFHDDYDHVRSFEPVNPAAPLPLRIANGLEGKSNGAELRIEYRPAARWWLWGGYAYVDLDLDRAPGSLDPFGGDVEAHDWRYQAFLRGALDVANDWEIDGTLRRIGRIANEDVPAYTELDLRIGWHVTRSMELSLTGSNLLHDSHGEFGPPGRFELERAVFALATWTPR